MNSPLEAPLRKKAKGEKTAVFVFALRRTTRRSSAEGGCRWRRSGWDAPNDPVFQELRASSGASATACREPRQEVERQARAVAASAGFGGRERPGISRFIGELIVEANVDVCWK